MADKKKLDKKAAKVLAKVKMPMSPTWHMGQVAAAAKLNALGDKVGYGAITSGDDNLALLQGAIDYLTAKAKLKQAFDDDEKEFLKEIYEALWWGGQGKGYPEAAKLADAYVNGDGTDVEIDAKVYSTSAIVQAAQAVMRRAIAELLPKAGKDTGLSLKSTDSRLQKRPDYRALFRGGKRKVNEDGWLLDNGILLAEQNNKRLKNADNRFALSSVSQRSGTDAITTKWRVDSLYDFESFERADHVTHVPLAANAVLKLPDGLSHYMVGQKIAKEFNYHAEWSETWQPADLPAPIAAPKAKK